MPEYTYPTNSATHFDLFLSGLVADATNTTLAAAPIVKLPWHDCWCPACMFDDGNCLCNLCIDADVAADREARRLGELEYQEWKQQRLANDPLNQWAERERQKAERQREQAQTAEERLHLAVARLAWEVSL